MQRTQKRFAPLVFSYSKTISRHLVALVIYEATEYVVPAIKIFYLLFVNIIFNIAHSLFQWILTESSMEFICLEAEHSLEHLRFFSTCECIRKIVRSTFSRSEVNNKIRILNKLACAPEAYNVMLYLWQQRPVSFITCEK